MRIEARGWVAAACGVSLALICLSSSTARSQTATAPGIVRSEFLFANAPFASAHASTLVETTDGFLAAWFGGSREGAPDVAIWVSREVDGVWSSPQVVATGEQPDGKRYPCWNPVLFQPRGGPLFLFYKVGPSPAGWWGMVRTSSDEGRTWGAPRKLPDGILGPIKNKPVQLADGTIISPSSTESSGIPATWRVHFEMSRDTGRTWSVVRPSPDASGADIDAIQPSVLQMNGGRLEAVGRTRSGRVFETWSGDSGRSWQPLTLGALPNPNSGIDAVTLRDGRQLIVYNHTEQGRSPLNVAISDDGIHWKAAAILERGPGEFSYPAVIQSGDGLVHITYTWNRQRIKLVVIDPARLLLLPMRDHQAGSSGVSSNSRKRA